MGAANEPGLWEAAEGEQGWGCGCLLGFIVALSLGADTSILGRAAMLQSCRSGQENSFTGNIVTRVSWVLQ